LGSSEKSNPRHYDPDGPRGLLRRGDDGTGPTHWWPIVVVVAALVVSSGWLITRSPVFAARRVQVTGDAHFTRDQVLRLAGVGRGTNLFWFHPGAAEKRLLRNPWIADAVVTRSLPSTLRIAIRERRAVAQIRVRPHQFLVVAADGTVLARSAGPHELPRLTFDKTTVPVVRRLGRPAWVVGAMPAWVRSRVHSVAQTAEGNIVIHLSSGVPVYFGDATQVQEKDQALAAVLHWAVVGGRPLASINVQAPLAPTATLHVYQPPVSVSVSTPTPGPSSSPSPTPSTKPSPTPSSTTSRRSRSHTARTNHTKHRH
jgi:cell division protein FtsQ